jgi:hypothetical protein
MLPVYRWLFHSYFSSSVVAAMLAFAAPALQAYQDTLVHIAGVGAVLAYSFLADRSVRHIWVYATLILIVVFLTARTCSLKTRKNFRGCRLVYLLSPLCWYRVFLRDQEVFITKPQHALGGYVHDRQVQNADFS